jgi:hypothetical protein
MSDCSQLPPWVSYLQALGVPIIAAVIAAVGTWIAARQMLIANDKLQLDAFDRQYVKRVARLRGHPQYFSERLPSKYFRR